MKGKDRTTVGYGGSQEDREIDPYNGVGPILFGMRRDEVAAALGVEPTAYATQSLRFLNIEEYWNLRLHVHYDGFWLCEFISLFKGAIPTLLGKALAGTRLMEVRQQLEPADPELFVSYQILSMGFGVAMTFSSDDAEATLESIGAFSRSYAKNYVLKPHYWEGYDIAPGVRVGGIRFGMAREELVDELCERPLRFPAFARQHILEWLADLGIHLSFDSEGHCSAVEFRGAVVPRLHDQVLLGTPYRKLLELFGSLDPYISVDDDGFTSYQLGIGIQAPVSTQGLEALVSGVKVFVLP